jgi:hypothetical protein
MSIFRAQISFPVDGVLPEDAMTITPHYFGDDAQGLAEALKTNLATFAPIGATKPFTIRIYDAEKAPPSYPRATAEQAGTPPNSTDPRELALCLSYFSTYNRPRYRGRLYIPGVFISGSKVSRPTGAQMQSVLDWRLALAENLPSAHNFVVYSRMDAESYTINNFWVDDEWDIVRSRGRKHTTRVEATFP